MHNDKPLMPGDSLWWQSRHAYWTPIIADKNDVPIERIGYSYNVNTLLYNLCVEGVCPDCGNTKMNMHDGKGKLWCPCCGECYETK